MNRTHPTNRGFTLIEIIVSLAVFIVVAVIAVGAFLKILDANKQSQALQTAMNNANFSLDSMARDLRVGEDFNCYNSVSDITVSSLSGKTACTPSLLQNQSPSTSVWPAIAFYSSEAPPGGWSCPNSPIHIYRYNPTKGVIEKAEQTCSGSTPNPVGLDSTFVPLTDPSFKIKSFGLDVDVTSQPKVFIFMTATAGSNVQNQTVFTIQTTASERIMNGQ